MAPKWPKWGGIWPEVREAHLDHPDHMQISPACLGTFGLLLPTTTTKAGAMVVCLYIQDQTHRSQQYTSRGGAAVSMSVH